MPVPTRGDKVNNFIYTLADYIKQLALDYPVTIGEFDKKSSLTIKPAGSEVIREYMDGMADIRLPFEIQIKTKNQAEALNVLQNVLNHVRNIDDFIKKSNRKDYVLLNTTIDQIPVFQTSKGNYVYYTSKLTVDITVV